MAGREIRAVDFFFFEMELVAVVKVCLHETRLVWEHVKKGDPKKDTVCSCQGAKENKNNNVAVAWVTTKRSRNGHPCCNAEAAPVVDHVVTWRSHSAAVLQATAPLAPATLDHLL